LILQRSNGTRTAEDLVEELNALLGSDAQAACRQRIEQAQKDGLLLVLRPGDSAPSALSADEFCARASELARTGSLLPAFICQHYTAQLLPENADLWRTLGALARKLGRRTDMRDAYERYTQLRPLDVEAEYILRSLRDEPPPARVSDRGIKQLFDRFASTYNDVMVEGLAYRAPAHLAEALAGEVRAAADLDVLELGCGTGLAGRHLLPFARHLVGIDLSPEMLGRAERTGKYDELEVAEITAWLLRTDAPTFDLIAACDTLNYFGDLRQVLLPAAKRLRRGGRLAFTIELVESVPFRLTDSGRYAHSELHVREVAQEAGLAVSRISRAALRYELGAKVWGLVAILQAPA
jgi:predicted TPR repeat methyltransferase